MKEKLSDLAPSMATAAKVLHAAFKILKSKGGELRGREVMNSIEEQDDLSDWEKERFEKTGLIRWQSILHFYTIDCVKTGYMRKSKGVWILTKEGEKALKFDEVELLRNVQKGYKAWKKDQPVKEKSVETESEIISSQEFIKANLGELEGKALEEIREFIVSKNPYEFQDLVAALLEGMGYHISEIAQRGPDGGIDIIAYNDPLGTKPPRIIVQVKHKPDASVPSDEIQKLSGTMKRQSDVGIFVSSGSFSKPSVKEARNSGQHIELIDFTRFVSLWQEYYDKLEDEQKNMLPLHPIYFLGSND